LYQNQSDFTIWEIGTQNQKEQKDRRGSITSKNIKISVMDGASPTQLKKRGNPTVEKGTPTTKEKSSPHSQKSDAKVSLANTGVVKRNLNRGKVKGKFITANEAGSEFAGMISNDPFEALSWLSRSLSSPQINPTFVLESRAGSASPTLPRSPNAGHRSGSGRKLTPSPHHYDHPEKHVDPLLIKSGIVRSRASSMTNIMEILRPRTPPSPHHHDHPLKSLAKPSGDSSSTSNGKKKVSHGRSTNPAKNASNRSNMQNEITQRDNDHPIECLKEKTTSEKKKGDSHHSPVGKIALDLTPLFLGRLHSTCRHEYN
jgi:hypothetical protein